jgi:hypothetical protein
VPVAHTCNPSNSGGSWFEASPRETVYEILSQNRAGRAAQVVKCLPSKREAQSSNPSTTKKKEKRNEVGPFPYTIYKNELKMD